MIEEKEQRTVVSTLVANGAEDIEMQIAEDAVPHLMDMMSKRLYSDPLLAVIREYTTNAIDAHTEAGVVAPVEVTTPVGTFSDPYVSIEDFGTGLTRNEIREIYSQYGRSAKRTSNDVVGCLGVGCKSGFAMGDQFTVISTKNCMTITVSVERNEAGTGTMRVVSEEKTDRPNGTKVIVPLPPNSGATEKARNLFRLGDFGDKVRLNGVQVPSVLEEAGSLRLADDLYTIAGTQSYVVMGNVPYPAEINHGLPSGWSAGEYHDPRSILAIVPIGAVSFADSREALRETPGTKAKLAEISDKVKATLKAAVQREIDKAATPPEGLKALLEWAPKLGQDNEEFNYKGRAIPSRFEPLTPLPIMTDNSGPKLTPLYMTENSDYKMGRADMVKWANMRSHTWRKTMIVYNYDAAKMTVGRKKKLRQHAENIGKLHSITRFALVAKKPPREITAWIGEGLLVDWADVAAIKLPRAVGGRVTASGRLPGSYDWYRTFTAAEWDKAKRRALLPANDPEAQASYLNGADDGYIWEHGMPGDVLDQTRPVYFVRSGGMGEASGYVGIIAEIHRATGAYIVPLTTNRVEKFRRNVPTAAEPRARIVEEWKTISKRISPTQKLAMHIQDQGGDLADLDETRLDDPELVKAIKLAKTDTTTWRKCRQKYSRFANTELGVVQWTNPLARYPLFTAVDSYWWRRNRDTNPDGGKFGNDMYLYFNAKYADLQSKGL